MNSKKIIVSKATPAHAPAMMALIKELAAYERAADEVSLCLSGLIEDGFGKKPIYEAFVAEADGVVVGMALCYEKYSTWKGRCLFLEDIIVSESHRRKGIGKLLMQEVIQLAKEKKSQRLEWQVLSWNEPAIAFYKKINAQFDPEWINVRLTIDQLKAYYGKD